MSEGQSGVAERVRGELQLRHVGKAAGVSCRALAGAVNATEREVRAAVSELRRAGVAVCGHPTSGYFIAESQEELETTCAFLRSRAMHSLQLEAQLRRVPLAEVAGQMAFDLKQEKGS